MKKYFVSGIGTDVGKTIVSAVLAEALQADYWKPIQTGELNNSDALKVRNLISNIISKIHPERYRLSLPISPNLAAENDGVRIELPDFSLPDTNNSLIIEGAGGLMVPINKKELIIDLIKFLDAEVILVSKNYLGSINHTLLSVEALKSRYIPIKGIIFNGVPNEGTEKTILSLTKLKYLGRIKEETQLTKKTIQEYGLQFKDIL